MSMRNATVNSMKIVVFWQVWRRNRQEFAVANQFCIYVGLRKQHLGYHNSWHFWYFTLLVWFLVLNCVDGGSAY
jgi:hypothetical protein